MVVQGILRQTSQDLHCHLLRTEESGQEFGIPAAISEVRVTEMRPWANSPVAIPVIDRFYRGSIGPGKVLMEIERSPQCLKRRGILLVLVVERYRGEGQVI